MLCGLSRFQVYTNTYLATLDCRSNSLGVRQSLRWIPDAQMTAHKSSGNSFASNGRQDGSVWRGVDRSSWLQVDLGEFKMPKHVLRTIVYFMKIVLYIY